MLAVFTPVAARRRVALSFEGSLDLEVHADPHKLRQALDNVLANALKFTPRGGRVRVRVGTVAGVAGAHPRTVFEIADTGPGVPEADRDRIFDRYKQGSRGRAAGGAGLGLAIAKGIAEAHHGTIDVVTGDLGGAAFRIALPE
jgi:signal transduction histidine kinase